MIHLPISPDRPLVLFTDLDGTLLDHFSYSAEVVRETLQLLDRVGIPVIFCSSKTFYEQIHLQGELGITHPFIMGNGSVVAVPRGYFSTPPTSPVPKGRKDMEPLPQPAILEEVPAVGVNEQAHDFYTFAHTDAHAMRRELAQLQDIKGFSAATDAELTSATGLSGDALKRARNPWFTETLLTQLDAEQLTTLRKKLAEKGWALSRGGRFFTVHSALVDKGKAVKWLKEAFRQNMPETPLFAAIGDSPNDAPMLEAVDCPFLVQRHDGTWAEMEIPGLVRIESIGPTGFLAAVKILLGDYTTRSQ
jgi:mannosyl-3-phosphoglycerate phosphatase family protein